MIKTNKTLNLITKSIDNPFFLLYHYFSHRKVAQLGRASGLGPEGCRFKSCLSDHLFENILIS